jgi:membrane-associated progesterone receptor component
MQTFSSVIVVMLSSVHVLVRIACLMLTVGVCGGFVSPVVFVVGPQQQHYDDYSCHERILNRRSSNMILSRLSSPYSSSSSRLHLLLMGDVSDIILSPTGGIAIAVLAFWAYVESAPDRVMKRQWRGREQDAGSQARYQELEEERRKLAYIEPKEYWKESELAEYDGTKNYDGPILFAADGLVLNVYKGRNFYGPGGEYHIFAGRDATRLLARTMVEEETEQDAVKPLTMAERAALAGWMWTFKGKYEVVGKLEGFDESTSSMNS